MVNPKQFSSMTVLNPSISLASSSLDTVNWQWQEWEGLPYLTCSLLENWSHGFFTKPFSPKTPPELVKVLDPLAQVYRLKQVHGNTVLKTGEILPCPIADAETLVPHPYPEADGLFTEQASQAIWVCTADCVPVLVADMETQQVAAVHAGWRGTAAKIVPEAIRHLQAQGSQIQNLRVALGPAITGGVYQVSLDVAAQVGATIAPPEVADCTPDLIDFLYQLPNSPLLEDSEPDKVYLDVRRVNSLQLEQLGLKSDQVAIAPYCTYQEPDYFFSYRRDQLKQVQWSGIVSGDTKTQFS